MRLATKTTNLRPYLVTVVILLGIFALALFIRSYFAFDMATRQGFLVSGGSDSFYHKRIIDRAVQTGEYLYFDPLLNYPLGYHNPRAPVYTWSTVLIGYLVSPFVGFNTDAGVWWSFEFGTALWGALTIFPTYFLAKEAFGRRTGYIAALFLAIMPAHIQRSPLSDADHDSMVLFFVVLSFYFFLKALRTLQERVYITRWSAALTEPKAFLWEVRSFFVENPRAVLFSLMAAFSLETVALIWQGWPYALVIFIGYLLVQLVVHRFRNQDPFGTLTVFAIMGGITLLLAAPYYVGLGFYFGWYSTPLFMYLGTLVFGLAFAATRRYPWVLAVPAILAAFALAIAVVGTLFFPSVTDALLSGFGYFPRNKIYETIAEAQSPGVSIAIISFGAVTYFLSLLGIAWMIVQFPKRPVPNYIFVVVWAFASIFMAMTQVRFLFNASPAFAVTSAWATIIIVEKLQFEEVGKTFRASAGRGRIGALRRSIKVRHVLGALFIGALLILPNVWLAVDAASPFEVKEDLDKEVANGIPSWLRPSGYQQGQLFYFGAFGFSEPLPNRYFPRAWDWLSQQDANVTPIAARPAYISWWDYGFEVVQEGKHPTVADNFQNGIETAGNFLAAQSEDQAVAILSLRLLDGDYVVNNHGKGFSPGVVAALQARGLNPTEFTDVYAHPGNYIATVLGNPSRFGPYDERMSLGNAKIIYLSTVMKERLTADQQADLYGDIQALTGWSIRYVSVDSRLVPFSAQNTGIFYAPMKLSDRRISEQAGGRVIPIDFFRIKATVANTEVDISEVRPGAQITNVRIAYQDMFYNSMLYRTFFGISPKQAGGATNGLPGLAGEAQAIQPQQGWMMAHFRVVYKTAYYNPYPRDKVANHTQDWEAINFPEALQRQDLIQQGKLNGTVDTSAANGLQNGIVFLKYYRGAIAQGHVTTADGRPLAGVRVTVQDEFGTPHYVNTTDGQGAYRVLLPFGKVDVKVSTGTPDNRTMVGSSLLASTSLNVTDPQAQWVDPNHTFTQDFKVQGQSLSGRVFLDSNRNGRLDPGEQGLGNAVVKLSGTLNLTTTLTTNGQGSYVARNLLPGTYSLKVSYLGRDFGQSTALVSPGRPGFHDVNLTAAAVTGRVTFEDGSPASGAKITVHDLTNQTTMAATAGHDGRYVVDGLLPGNFTFSAEAATEPTARIAPRTFTVGVGANVTQDVRITRSATVRGGVTVSGVPGPGAPVAFRLRGSTPGATTAMAGSDSSYSALLPLGTYDVYSTYQRGNDRFAFVGSLTVASGSDQTYPVDLTPASLVHGTTLMANNSRALGGVTLEFQGTHGFYTTASGTNGSYRLLLPADRYTVTATRERWWTQETLTAPTAGDHGVVLALGRLFSGYLYRDMNGNGRFDPSQEGVANAPVAVQDGLGHNFTRYTDTVGFFDVVGFNRTSYALATSPAGYSSNGTPLRPLSDYGNQTFLALTADPVAVSGSVTVDGVAAPTGGEIRFQGRAAGARNATATLGGGGAYSLSLVPGEYVITANLSLAPGTNAFAQSNDSFTVRVGLASMERPIDLVKRFRVMGNMTIDGSPVAGSVAFDGPEHQAINVNVTTGAYSLYLLGGTYNVRTLLNREGTNYMYLHSHAIAGRQTIDLPLVKAVTLGGSPKASGPGPAVKDRTVVGVVSLTFTQVSGGGQVTVNATGGTYTIILPPGDYRVGANQHTTDAFDGALHYVRYSADVPATVAPDAATFDVPLARALDNSTLRGVVRSPAGGGTAATLTFRATDDNTITARATAAGDGGYEVQLAPGPYDLYAVGADGSSVFLGGVTVDPRSDTTLDIPLTPGHTIRGLVTYGTSIPTPANLTVVGDNTFEGRAGSGGAYSLFVPPGSYRVEAKASVPERNTQVRYQGQGNATVVDADVELNLALNRVTHRAVGLSWDASQAQTIPPGGSVTYIVTVQNRGSIEDSFHLSGEPKDWTFTFDRETVALDFGGGANETTVQVRITAPANAIVEHPAVDVMATSDNDKSVSNQVAVQVNIEQRQAMALQASATPATFNPGNVDVPVTVRNTGNGADRFFVDIINADDLRSNGWNATLVDPRGNEVQELHNLTIAANGTQDVTIRLRLTGTSARGGTIQMVARPENRQDLERRLEVAIPTPSLALGSGGVQVKGPGASAAQPFPWLYVALASVALASLGLFAWQRQRGRRKVSRRRRK